MPCLRTQSQPAITKLACCHLQCLLCHSEIRTNVQAHEPISTYRSNVNWEAWLPAAPSPSLCPTVMLVFKSFSYVLSLEKTEPHE